EKLIRSILFSRGEGHIVPVTNLSCSAQFESSRCRQMFFLFRWPWRLFCLPWRVTRFFWALIPWQLIVLTLPILTIPFITGVADGVFYYLDEAVRYETSEEFYAFSVARVDGMDWFSVPGAP